MSKRQGLARSTINLRELEDSFPNLENLTM